MLPKYPTVYTDYHSFFCVTTIPFVHNFLITLITFYIYIAASSVVIYYLLKPTEDQTYNIQQIFLDYVDK